MNVETAYEILFTFATIILSVLGGILLIRSIKSSSICGRLLCVNMISSIIISLIMLLSAKNMDPGLIDIALIYVLMSFMAVVVFAKVYIPAGNNNDRTEEEND